jgi:hypothetical protein
MYTGTMHNKSNSANAAATGQSLAVNANTKGTPITVTITLVYIASKA